MATTAAPSTLDRRTPGHHKQFIRFAWTVLAWNLLVVLWGAYVRASGSGAGCGNNWPLCNGQVVPAAPALATVIEFTHRLMSGGALVLIAALYAWAFRQFPRGHVVRLTSALAIVFIVAEALLGAGLVLFRYVAANESAGRAVYLSAHLVNTQLLLAVLAITASRAAARTPALTGERSAKLLATLPVALVVSVTGAVAALGDTLYPASSLASGLRQDLSATAHVLLRLRVFHPAVAILGGAYIIYAALIATRQWPNRRVAFAAAGLAIAQLCAGALNVLTLAPVWMQIVHLLLADLLWLSLVLLSLRSLQRRPA